MNWVGGTLSRLRGRDDKKIQREFFEKKRYERNLDNVPIGMHSPTMKREIAISQDLLSLQTVLHTHSESHNKLYKQFKHPNICDLKPKIGLKRTIPYDFVQQPVLNDKYNKSEGFQDLDTPSTFLDLKRWKGEHKPSKTLGLPKGASCLRQFQASEQKMYQREGVDECEKENIFPNEGQSDAKPEEVVVKETGLLWNKKGFQEQNVAPENSKWLDFLYGKNKAESRQTVHQPEVTHAGQAVVPVPDITTSGDRNKYDTGDLMEFERERAVRSESGYPEDPFYLTLLSNRDSFKGYKRPRIDAYSSGLAASKVSRDVSMGFLDESVFATPADDNIFRPDGNLTENPLPYSNKSGMRSIRDFIADKTSKYDKNHDALTDDEITENLSEESSQEEITEIIHKPNLKPIKAKFVVPLLKRECSPTLVQAPIEEKQPISNSYDTFLQSLVAPNIALESFTRDVTHPLLQTNDCVNSLMVPIIKWKEGDFAMDSSKEQLTENFYRSDRVEDKESTLNTNAGSYAEECVEQSIVRNYVNKAEKTVNSHLEADTNESGIISEIHLVSREDDNTELTSSNSEQLRKEYNGEILYEVKLEEQDCSGEASKIAMEVDQGLDKVETRVSTSERIDIATMKMNVEELIEHEISNETDNIPENKETLSQSSDSPMEVPIPDFPSQHCNKNNNNTSQEHTQEEIKYIINLVNSCIEEARLLLEKIPEVEEVSLQVTRVLCHQGVTLQEKSSNTELFETECKDCQTSLKMVQKECQTDNQVDTNIIQDKSSNTELFETECKDCQTSLEMVQKECQTDNQVDTNIIQDKSSNTELFETECKDCQTSLKMVQKECQTDNQVDNNLIQEDKSDQTEERVYHNNGNQTEILLIRFPITSNSEQVINADSTLTRSEYENFILYQQQIIRALQEVELRL